MKSDIEQTIDARVAAVFDDILPHGGSHARSAVLKGARDLVRTVWIGKIYPPMPDTSEATNTSSDYWAHHAVIYNGQPIVSSTLTKTCPY